MRPRGLIWLGIAASLGLGSGAAAEMYRCQGADAAPIYTDDASRCAAPHAPSGRIVTTPPAAPRPEPARPLRAGELRGLLPALGPDVPWEVLEEPVETTTDPELRAQGLHASLARHYTRHRGRVSEVCSIEVWAFAEAAQAAVARAALGQPGWWAREAGPLLVLGHGVRVERGVGTRHETNPECAALAARTHANALLR